MSAPAAVTAGLTWEEFLALPDDPELRHAELVDGEVVMNPPTSLHEFVVMRLLGALDAWTREGTGRGEVTMEPPVQIAERRGYLPDVAWYAEDQCAPPGTPPVFSGPPTLAVEVISPSSRALDTVRKRADYARIGVGEFWVIDPQGPDALVLRQGGAEFVLAAEVAPDGRLTSPLLPGFAVPLAELVRRPGQR